MLCRRLYRWNYIVRLFCQVCENSSTWNVIITIGGHYQVTLAVWHLVYYKCKVTFSKLVENGWDIFIANGAHFVDKLLRVKSPPGQSLAVGVTCGGKSCQKLDKIHISEVPGMELKLLSSGKTNCPHFLPWPRSWRIPLRLLIDWLQEIKAPWW